MVEEGNFEISKEEFKEFLKAPSQDARLKILLIHSKKNNLRITRSTIMEQQVKTPEQIEKEMLEINNQFREFLHTKGIVAKFKLAFANMGESARRQHEQDKRQIEAVKNSEENKQFVEFVHTKGFKAKCRLVIENMKKGAVESRQKTAGDIAKVKAQTQASIAVASGKPVSINPTEWTAEDISREFNEFLKSKGLDGEYTVVVAKNDD